MDLPKFKKRVRIGATILMVLTACELVRYMYVSFSRAIRFSFADPERWQGHWLVEDDVLIDMPLRISYFSIWTIVILASVAGSLAGIYLLNEFRKGNLFTQKTARGIQIVGGILFIAMLLDTGFGAVDQWMISFRNLENVVPIQFSYDPSDAKVMVLSAVLFIFGWVAQEAIKIVRTNEEYI